MNVFSRSWEFTKLSFRVIKKDKELLLYPMLASFFSLLYSIAMLVPSIIIPILEATNPDYSTLIGTTEYIFVFLTYLGLAFISTFFNVCVVYTAKVRFEGGNAKFGESLGFAIKRIPTIFMWSLLSATVGLFFYLLDNIAQSLGKAGQIIVSILRGILGMLWSILTIFVVPAMVYYNLSPFKAIKKSTQTLKKTWGESILRYYGLGLLQFLFIFLGIIIAGILLFLFYQSGITAILIIVGAFLVYAIIVSLVFQVAEKVFNTALFVYADKGKAPTGYKSGILREAIKVK
ncbi:MAG: DUF6159 family protein [Candidatus Lokiarchaeota archaeon]|nr:DUF6159 family protein [Candidatus Harpocratesius repetitus]